MDLTLGKVLNEVLFFNLQAMKEVMLIAFFGHSSIFINIRVLDVCFGANVCPLRVSC